MTTNLATHSSHGRLGTTERFSVWVRRVAYVGLALSVALWTLELTVRTVRGRVLGFGEHQAMLLNGVHVPIDTLTTLIRSDGNIRGQAMTARLVIAFSDECGACERQAPNWPKLVSGLVATDSVLFLSFSGDRLINDVISALRGTGVPWQLREVTDSVAFGARTGIGSTPIVLLLDGTSAIRFRAEDASEETALALRQAVSRLHSGASAAAIHVGEWETGSETAIVSSHFGRR